MEFGLTGNLLNWEKQETERGEVEGGVCVEREGRLWKKEEDEMFRRSNVMSTFKLQLLKMSAVGGVELASVLEVVENREYSTQYA